MSCTDHLRLVVGEQHRGAIGGEDSEQQLGPVGDHRIGMGPIFLRPGTFGIDGIGRMNLVDGDQLCVGKDGGDRSFAILEDRGAVVLAAVADVEPGNLAGRNAAATAEEPVRNRAEARRADGLDAGHSAFTMITSSSA